MRIRCVVLVMLLTVLLVLMGCNAPDDSSSDAVPSPSAAGEDLCAITSSCEMAETEGGYYLLTNGLLYYADKGDLSNWVLVCAMPNCTHATGSLTCTARINNSFVLKDDRIYFLTDTDTLAGQPSESGFNRVLASIALDGSDRKLEYALEETVLHSGGGSISDDLQHDHWITACRELQPDGTMEGRLYLLDASGKRELFTRTGEINACTTKSGRLYVGFRGDFCFWSSLIGDNLNTLYWLEGDTLCSADMTGYKKPGSYFSGGNLWFFRTGDGYYQVDLRTGAETRLEDAQLEYSGSEIVLPNCVLESTLLGKETLALRQPEQEHTMVIFDGSGWRPVTLPEELKTATDTQCLFVRAISSDSIFFIMRDTAQNTDESTALYRIALGEDQYTVEYCATLTPPNSSASE